MVNLKQERRTGITMTARWRGSARVGACPHGRQEFPSTNRISLWPNRDPLRESSGLNVYSFASNKPTHTYDLLGLTIPSQSASTYGCGCSHDLFYEVFASDKVKRGQPHNTVFVKSINNIIENVNPLVPHYDSVGYCCRGSCIKTIRISNYGSNPGSLPQGDGKEFIPSTDYGNQQVRAPFRELLYQECLVAQSTLRSLSSDDKPTMCAGGIIECIICKAGGDDGTLQRVLDQECGSAIKVILHNGSCSPLGPITVPLP